MFQLPFGATGMWFLTSGYRTSVVDEYHLDRADNLVSVLLAIGSPALAGYSLAITRLNSRWLSRQFQNYPQFPNNVEVPLALSALQHIPLGIDVSGSVIPSLIALPQNDDYWKFLAATAKRTRQWSIPMVMNIFWVLVAFLFTVVGSLVDFQDVISVPGDAGYPIAAVWTYLIPLVIGWLHVGSQVEAGQLHHALDEAHRKAYVATAGEPISASQAGGRAQALMCSTELIDHVNADEKKTAPIFNYARVFIWSQHTEYILKLYRHAAAKAQNKEGVKYGSRFSANLDPRHPAATTDEVVLYCMEKPTAASGTVSPVIPVFATEVFQRVLFATALAHVLQWGTTGASILIHIFTPPKGFGCRALTFTLYGAAGTLSLWLLLLSSILAHSARRQANGQERRFAKMFIGCVAALLRWLGKTIAIMNGIGMLLACCMQFGGLYSNCFCSSDLFGGNKNGTVQFVAPDIKGSEVYGYWIGGITLAFGMSGMYAFAIYLATPMDH